MLKLDFEKRLRIWQEIFVHYILKNGKPLKAKYSGGHGNLTSLQVLLHVSSTEFERKQLKNLRKAIKIKIEKFRNHTLSSPAPPPFFFHLFILLLFRFEFLKVSFKVFVLVPLNKRHQVGICKLYLSKNTTKVSSASSVFFIHFYLAITLNSQDLSELKSA